MAPVQIPGVNLGLLTGPLILGYMWSYCFYGMFIVQVYLYSDKFPDDRKALKLLVWSLFLLETVFTIFMTIGAWNAYGPGWGSILISDWSWEPLSPLSKVMAEICTQKVASMGSSEQPPLSIRGTIP